MHTLTELGLVSQTQALEAAQALSQTQNALISEISDKVFKLNLEVSKSNQEMVAQVQIAQCAMLTATPTHDQSSDELTPKAKEMLDESRCEM